MATAEAFRNESGLEFVDISSEEWREYTFSDGEKIVIKHPIRLHVSDSGHRIFDASGISHFVPMTWKHLRWKAKDGEPHFVL